MPFTSPLALLGLLFIPAVIAMYLLKLRRDEAIVPSTLLWTRLLTDVEANAPWQKLRRSLLLLLQLLLVAILALLAARPFVERPASLARDLVLVVDTSASMGATDVLPDRLTVAKEAAIEALRDLPTGGKVSVIAADRTARIVVNNSSDLSRVRQAIEEITVSPSRGDLGDALELASKLAARSGDAQVLVATDAALAGSPTTRVNAPVKVLHVGRDRQNQAIVALAVKVAPSGVTRSVFVSLANLDVERATRRLEVWSGDRLIEVRDVVLDAQARTDIVLDDVPGDVGAIEVRLAGADPQLTTPPDQLAIDDRAWAIIPPVRVREILVVGAGDPYLETALSYLPNAKLFGLAPADYPKGAARTDGTAWDLVIFEDFLPTTLPDVPILAIAPPRTSALGTVTGTLENPGIATLDPDEPILRYVDLSTTHIAEAAKLTTPDWARTIIPGPKGSPLLYAGSRDGLPTAVLAFEPRQSDLPLQVAFPILVANLTGELLGGSTAPTDAVEPGTPVALVIPPGASGLTVTAPDGTVTEFVRASSTDATVTYAGAIQPGIYVVTPIVDTTDPTPSPSGRGSPSASPSLTPGSSGSPPPDDPFAPVRFAVDLFDVGESSIAPGSAAAIEALGRGPAGSPSPGSGSGGGTGATERPTTRDELWIPIVLIVLIVLSAEWALYHRDGVARIRRGIVVRLGRTDGSAG